MTNPKGLPLAAHRGRVVAPLQHLPCQKTNPRGCVAGVGIGGLGLSVYLHAYMRTVLKDQPYGVALGGASWQGCRFAPTPALPKDQA